MAKKSAPNRIAEFRRSRKLSQPQLAEALGVHWITISKLERGITKLNWDWAERVASVLKVDIYDLMPASRRVRNIAISAYVHKGGIVEAIEEGKEEVFDFDSKVFSDIDTEWLEVKGDALYPYFKDGDIFAITWVHDIDRRNEQGEIDYSPYYGRFCLVEDEDGDQFIGSVSHSIDKDRIDLHNANYPPLKNIKPKALAQVTIAFMGWPGSDTAAPRREPGSEQ